MTSTDFLLEIGTEELPPKSLTTIAKALHANISEACLAAQLTFASEQSRFFATPRRLAVLLKDLSLQQPRQQIYRKGPSVAAAYDAEDQPTKALQGFLRSCHAQLHDITIEQTEKGAWVVYQSSQAGKTTQALLPDIIQQAVRKLPMSKPMRWGNHSEEFIRPAHWLVALLGDTILPLTLLGLSADRISYGHRFLAPEPITLSSPTNYVATLQNAYVIPCFAKRRAEIEQQILHQAKLAEAIPVIETTLLDEVTALVEWPVAKTVPFDKDFLNMPKEVLITAMQSHQKSFALLNKHDKQQRLLPAFITISNLASRDPQAIISGNEKVMCARLTDAKFFYEQDQLIPLENRLDALKTIVFQQQLGNLYERSQRIAQLAEYLATILKADTVAAKRAGLLCKADLTTDMVGEFPSLQGLMAYYYARETEGEIIVQAIKEHYQPRFADDNIPGSDLACIVALADKIDSLVGIFGINQAPTGDKDPFALRRAAIGTIRIILEKQYSIDLQALIAKTITNYKDKLTHNDVQNEVKQFLFERLKHFYKEQHINPELFEATYQQQNNDIVDLSQRLQATLNFLKTAQATILISANKRAANILKKSGIGFNDKLTSCDHHQLVQVEEKNLWQALQSVEPQIKHYVNDKQYEQALITLTHLAEPLDQFFEHVMVMVENENLRQQRLLLIHHLYQLMTCVTSLDHLPHDK